MPEQLGMENAGDLYRNVKIDTYFDLEEGQRLEARLIAKTDSGLAVNTVVAAWENIGGEITQTVYTD